MPLDRMLAELLADRVYGLIEAALALVIVGAEEPELMLAARGELRGADSDESY